jgi:hypothetical protein
MYYVLHFIIAIVTATNACTYYVYSIKFECLLFRAVDDTFK